MVEEPPARALTPTGSPADARIAGDGQHRPVRIVSRQAHHHPTQSGMIEKALQRVLENAATGHLQVLLGAIGGHARADTGGWNHQPESRAHSVSR